MAQQQLGQYFSSVRLSLGAAQGNPGEHEFDAVSTDKSIVCGIKTAFLETVDEDSPEQVAQAWDEEIGRRIAEMDEGKAQMGSWEDTLARLRARFVR